MNTHENNIARLGVVHTKLWIMFTKAFLFGCRMHFCLTNFENFQHVVRMEVLIYCPPVREINFFCKWAFGATRSNVLISKTKITRIIYYAMKEGIKIFQCTIRYRNFFLYSIKIVDSNDNEFIVCTSLKILHVILERS